jgi:hypothetical protein
MAITRDVTAADFPVDDEPGPGMEIAERRDLDRRLCFVTKIAKRQSPLWIMSAQFWLLYPDLPGEGQLANFHHENSAALEETNGKVQSRFHINEAKSRNRYPFPGIDCSERFAPGIRQQTFTICSSSEKAVSTNGSWPRSG